MFHNILSCYLAMALAIFCVWFGLFISDKTTPKNHLVSWVVLLIAPLFWPIVLPLSIRELVIKLINSQNCQERIQLKEALINLQTNELNVN